MPPLYRGHRFAVVTESCAVGEFLAYTGGDELDDQDQNHEAPDERADHCPAAAVQALYQRGTDSAGTDNTERRGILKIDVETVDGR